MKLEGKLTFEPIAQEPPITFASMDECCAAQASEKGIARARELGYLPREEPIVPPLSICSGSNHIGPIQQFTEICLACHKNIYD